MIRGFEITKEPGNQGVCGLFGNEELAGSDPQGLILALTEIVEHFQITWGVTPLHESDPGENVEIGFVLDLNGTHELAANHRGRICKHCANLMLALRIIGDWLFPPQGKCSSCEVQAYNNFIRGDQQGQPEACSTRAIRLVSHLGARCPLGACHAWCMTKMTERLNAIGVVERAMNPLSAERVGARI